MELLKNQRLLSSMSSQIRSQSTHAKVCFVLRSARSSCSSRFFCCRMYARRTRCSNTGSFCLFHLCPLLATESADKPDDTDDNQHPPADNQGSTEHDNSKNECGDAERAISNKILASQLHNVLLPHSSLLIAVHQKPYAPKKQRTI